MSVNHEENEKGIIIVSHIDESTELIEIECVQSPKTYITEFENEKCNNVTNTNKIKFQKSFVDEGVKMVYQEKSTVIEEYCLICRDAIEAANKAHQSNIFHEKNCTKLTRTSILFVLSNILKMDISKQNVHSEHLCYLCLDLLDEWDNLTSRSKTIQNVIMNTFQETCDILKTKNSLENTCSIGKENARPEAQDIFNIKVKQKRGRHRRKIPNKEKRLDCFDSVFEKGRIPEVMKEMSSYIPKVCQDVPESHCLSVEQEKADILDMRLQTSSDSEVQNLSCDSCSFKTKTSAEMVKHTGTHFCSICGVFLTFPKQMKMHLVKVHNYSKKDICQMSLFKCHICSKTYSSYGGLYTHKKTIHSRNSFVCDVCGQTFKHERLLASHALRHEEKKVKCLECNSTFFVITELNKHVNRVHRKVKPYECPVCNRFFCQRSTLTHHMSQHRNSVENVDVYILSNNISKNVRVDKLEPFIEPNIIQLQNELEKYESRAVGDSIIHTGKSTNTEVDIVGSGTIELQEYDTQRNISQKDESNINEPVRVELHKLGLHRVLSNRKGLLITDSDSVEIEAFDSHRINSHKLEFCRNELQSHATENRELKEFNSHRFNLNRKESNASDCVSIDWQVFEQHIIKPQHIELDDLEPMTLLVNEEKLCDDGVITQFTHNEFRNINSNSIHESGLPYISLDLDTITNREVRDTEQVEINLDLDSNSDEEADSLIYF